MGQSRNEDILQNMLGASNEIKPPQSRVEKLLQELSGQMPEANPSEGTTTGTLERLKIGDDIYSVEGGGSGTSDYDALNNKPQIAGTTLSGNKSLADLGIASATTVSGILDGASIDSFADVETALAGKQDTLTFDNSPTENSNNPVKSGGVYTALAGKQDTITAGDDLKFSGSTLNVEVSVPYIDEYDLSTDGNGWTVITKKHKGEVVSTNTYQSGTYATYDIDGCFTLTCTGGTPYWQVTLTKASTDDPAETTYGWGYGETPAVTNIQFELAETGTASEFITALGISVEGLASSKQPKTDNNLTTTSKEVTGAINEVKSGLTNVNSNLAILNGETGSVSANSYIEITINSNEMFWLFTYRDNTPYTSAYIVGGTWSGTPYVAKIVESEHMTVEGVAGTPPHNIVKITNGNSGEAKYKLLKIATFV